MTKHPLPMTPCVFPDSDVSHLTNSGLPEIGRMKQLTFHPVSGHVVAKNENTILICDFVYDGEGPDAFLVVGNRQVVRFIRIHLTLKFALKASPLQKIEKIWKRIRIKLE